MNTVAWQKSAFSEVDVSSKGWGKGSGRRAKKKKKKKFRVLSSVIVVHDGQIQRGALAWKHEIAHKFYKYNL
jgi:hypothetical protein